MYKGNKILALIMARGGSKSLPTKYTRRQDFPKTYIENGAIYFNHINTFLPENREKDFVPDHAIAYVMPYERSLDIDTMLDFKIAFWIVHENVK